MTNEQKAAAWKFFDLYGWPVERIIGRPITNFIRLILMTKYIVKLPPNMELVNKSYMADIEKKLRLCSEYVRRTSPETYNEIFPDQCSTSSPN